MKVSIMRIEVFTSKGIPWARAMKTDARGR
jgi:hypothetical protein